MDTEFTRGWRQGKEAETSPRCVDEIVGKLRGGARGA